MHKEWAGAFAVVLLLTHAEVFWHFHSFTISDGDLVNILPFVLKLPQCSSDYYDQSCKWFPPGPDISSGDWPFSLFPSAPFSSHAIADPT